MVQFRIALLTLATSKLIKKGVGAFCPEKGSCHHFESWLKVSSGRRGQLSLW